MNEYVWHWTVFTIIANEIVRNEDKKTVWRNGVKQKEITWNKKKWRETKRNDVKQKEMTRNKKKWRETKRSDVKRYLMTFRLWRCFYLRQPFPLCHYKDPKGTESDVYRLGIWDTCLSGFKYPYYWVCPQWFPPEKSVPVSQAASVSPLQEVLPISPPVPSPGQGWIPAVRLSFPTNLNSSQKLIVIVSTK